MLYTSIDVFCEYHTTYLARISVEMFVYLCPRGEVLSLGHVVMRGQVRGDVASGLLVREVVRGAMRGRGSWVVRCGQAGGVEGCT